MFQRIIPFAIFYLFACSLTGQSIQKVPFDVNNLRASAQGRVPCDDNMVGGPISFENDVLGNSNSTPGIGETIYLCFGDSINISDIGMGATFDGDPDGTTRPGVGFAIYDCPPTEDGPNLTAILGDCLIGDPMIEGEVRLSIDFDEPYGGSTTFRNIEQSSGNTFQEEYNEGKPLQWWFAPITFDVLEGVDGRWESTMGEDGACITVGLDQTFSVVYLNPIEFITNAIGVDVVYPFGGNGSQARFNVAGGLPEFDTNEFYDITITNVDDPSVTGMVITGPAGHRSFPTIEVPQSGTYRIDVSDGKSCSFSRTILMDEVPDSQTNLEFFVDGPTTVEVGREFCVDVKSNGFDSIVAATIILSWDPMVLDSGRFVIGSEYVEPMTVGSEWSVSDRNADEGEIIGLFSSQDVIRGSDIPNDATLFTLCFTPLVETDCAIIEFIDRAQSGTTKEIVGAANNGAILNIPNDPDNNLKVRVINPDKVTAVISEKKDACPGIDNGSFQINTLGGTPPFQVAISGTKSDGPDTISTDSDFTIFEDLPAGMYDVLIRELSTGEFTSASVEILEADLDVSVIETNPRCNGGSDGMLQAQVAIDGNLVDDLRGYSFKWVNNADDTIARDEIATRLPQGSYTVFVESNNGCADFGRTSLFDPMPITFTPSIDAPSCSGVADGTVTVDNVVGGTGPYSIEWSDGATDFSNTAIESDTFGFVVTDDLGCKLTDTIVVEAEIELVINTIANFPRNVSCFGLNDGAIDIRGTQAVMAGGTPVNGDYTFNWSPNVTNIDNSVVQSSLADSLAAGSYFVTLTNTGLPAGCQAVQEFEISEPDTLIVETVDITNVTSCSLINPDGEINVTPTGGTPFADGSYQYSWLDTAGTDVGSTAALTGQPSGLLTLTVTDQNGCEVTIDTAIGTPPPPEVQFQFDDIALNCATDEAELTVTATPGRAGVTIDPNSFMWSHDASITGATASVGPDTFMVAITDSDGCIGGATAIVTAPPAIRTNAVDFLKLPCFGAEDGTISVEIAGGAASTAGAYSIQWIDADGAPVLGGVLDDAAPGDYNLMVTDANNCAFDTIITLASLPRIVVDFPTADVSGVACFDTPVNQCNGEATANAAYDGIGGGEFTFTWGATGETVGATNTFNSNSLCAGFQKISVIDTSGCEMIDSVLIPSPDEILLVANVEDVTCFGDGDGSAEIDATGGNGGFTFAWSDGSTDQTRTDLVAQVYDIAIIDRDGCTGQGQVEITEPAELLVTIDDTRTNNVICEGDANGRITVIVDGGNPGLNYTWTNNVSAIESAAGLAPGTYLIDVEDSKGCMGQANYTVEEPTPITAQVEWTPIQCNGFQTNIGLTNVAGGNTGDYTFSVDDSPARPISETILEFGGDRKISIFDAEGCRVDSIYNIEQPRPLEATFVENLVEVDLGGSIELDLDINGDLPIAEIIWSQGGEQVDSSFMCAFVPCDNPTVNPLDNTVYTALVFDANDCMAEASITVNVDKNRNVYIPNVFAPNNAGFDTNDRFAVFTGSGVKQINYAKVFNRWGTMVADLTEKRINGASETTEIWDGFIKGEKANQGVYIYIVEIEFIDNTVLLYRGDVALLR